MLFCTVLRKKDFANLSQLIEDAIARCLAEEGIKQEVIERFLSESRPFIFTKMKDRFAVARLNKACEVAKIFESYVDPEMMYQAVGRSSVVFQA